MIQVRFVGFEFTRARFGCALCSKSIELCYFWDVTRAGE